MASPTAQFVTATRSGQILRVQMAAVRAGESASEVTGFLLVLDNVTRDFEQDSVHDRLMHGLTAAGREFLDRIRAAHGRLLAAGDDITRRGEALATIEREMTTVGQRIAEFEARRAAAIKTRWPLEDMLADDLLAAIETQVENHAGCEVSVAIEAQALWLRIDSFALLQAITSLASRIVQVLGAKTLTVHLSLDDGRARIDLAWPADRVPAQALASWLAQWESAPMQVGDQSSPLTVRDVVERHQGQLRLERISGQQSIAVLLPLAEPVPETTGGPGVHEARPEYYDFDLFERRDGNHARDDSRLADLTFTVFDTETTGLQPSGGDQIIQIGAARIVNGKLLRQEVFEQLVDPGRRIPAASIPIHGIRDDMVSGKPGIDQVLPVFHAFADDTILVAHNAAFDMKFLQMREQSSGVVFRQPVLDTLLLSALVHPNQPSHRLEAIAQRFDITVHGRHTALGDALVTAEVLLRLIPLLEAMGIRTLGEALEASQGTMFARVRY
ncbi:MAG: 3'-5' exonuclease [Burkholderiaceae bacterium]